MNIGVMSDVHANLPALDAVLDDLQNAERIIHAGDIVGYNAFPREVIERFQERNIDSIAGNHDRKVVGDDSFDFPDHAEKVIDWTSNELSEKNEKFINQLSSKLRLQIDGYTIQVVHGSPYDTDKYIYPTDITLELVERLDDDIDILIWGHTHYSIVTRLNSVLLLNPGSVGQPRDGDLRPSYAIFDTQTGNIELKRAEYNINKTVEKASSECFPQQIIDSLRQPD